MVMTTHIRHLTEKLLTWVLSCPLSVRHRPLQSVQWKATMRGAQARCYWSNSNVGKLHECSNCWLVPSYCRRKSPVFKQTTLPSHTASSLCVLHHLHIKRLSMRAPPFDSAECFFFFFFGLCLQWNTYTQIWEQSMCDSSMNLSTVLHVTSHNQSW